MKAGLQGLGLTFAADVWVSCAREWGFHPGWLWHFMTLLDHTHGGSAKWLDHPSIILTQLFVTKGAMLLSICLSSHSQGTHTLAVIPSTD